MYDKRNGIAKVVGSVFRKGCISWKWTDGAFSHYYPNRRVMPNVLFRKSKYNASEKEQHNATQSV